MINFFETLFEARERKFQQEKLFRGESVDLVARITTDGVLDQLSDYQISGVYQPTDNLSGPFYPMDAEIVDGKAILHWTGDNDFGKNGYNVWGLLTKDGKAAYPVCWRLNFAHSPSYPLSSVDPIPRTIDFSQYDLLNAPWLPLSGDVMEADATIRFPLSDDIKVSIGKDGFGITKEITTETEAMSGWCWYQLPDPVPEYEIQWLTESEIANWDSSTQGTPPWQNVRLRLCSTKPEETITEISSIAKFSLPNDEEGDRTIATREWAQENTDEKLNDYLPLSGGVVTGSLSAIGTFQSSNFKADANVGIMIGYNAKAKTGSIAIGSSSDVTNAHFGSSNVAVGTSAKIGESSETDCAVAIGNGSKVNGNYGIAIGHSADAIGANSIAIGSSGSRVQALAPESIQIGGLSNGLWTPNNTPHSLKVFDKMVLSGDNLTLNPERIPYLSDYQTKSDAAAEHTQLSNDLTAWVEGQIPEPTGPLSKLTIRRNDETLIEYNPEYIQPQSVQILVPTKVQDLDDGNTVVRKDELSTELSDYATVSFVNDSFNNARTYTDEQIDGLSNVYATEQYVQDYVAQHGGGSTGKISACLSSLEFTDESYLPTDPFGNLDVDSISLADIGNKVNKILQLLKRDSAGPSGGDPTKTYVKYNDGTISALTISGTLYAVQNKENAVQVKVGNSVTSIAVWAFANCSNLTSIIIPDSVTSIGSYTFNNCSGLTSITIPDSVTSIGGSAFDGCSGLKSVMIGNGVMSIEDNTFYGCSNLTSVTIGNNVTSIGSNVFYNCSSLTSITIPDSVTSIGGYAFYNCSSLTSVTIPNSVTSIGKWAFMGCSGLTSVTFTGKTMAEVQAMTNYPWKIATGQGKIICTDGTL